MLIVSLEQFKADYIKARNAKKQRDWKAKDDIENFLIGNRANHNAKWKYRNKLLLHK